ncbi:MAG: family 78 glycoside hydrolase catalytic domain, partial [Clostridia bacterium]|nr:family 78 glycoside hydrolase catalytic domain [Clostridia bacterium]
MTGREVIKVSGERGAKVTIRFAERIDGNNELNVGSLRNAKNTDVYILSGKGEESYSPRFTYRGFRYGKISIEGNAKILDVYAEKLRTDTKNVGKFTCSDEDLNKLHIMSRNTE